jgi:hypothetical protein
MHFGTDICPHYCRMITFRECWDFKEQNFIIWNSKDTGQWIWYFWWNRPMNQQCTKTQFGKTYKNVVHSTCIELLTFNVFFIDFGGGWGVGVLIVGISVVLYCSIGKTKHNKWSIKSTNQQMFWPWKILLNRNPGPFMVDTTAIKFLQFQYLLKKLSEMKVKMKPWLLQC